MSWQWSDKLALIEVKSHIFIQFFTRLKFATILHSPPFRYCHCLTWIWMIIARESSAVTGQLSQVINWMNWRGHSRRHTIQMYSQGKANMFYMYTVFFLLNKGGEALAAVARSYFRLFNGSFGSKIGQWLTEIRPF